MWKKGKFSARNNSKTLHFLYNWDRATIQEGVVLDEVYTHGKTVCTVCGKEFKSTGVSPG